MDKGLPWGKGRAGGRDVAEGASDVLTFAAVRRRSSYRPFPVGEERLASVCVCSRLLQSGLSGGEPGGEANGQGTSQAQRASRRYGVEAGTPFRWRRALSQRHQLGCALLGLYVEGGGPSPRDWPRVVPECAPCESTRPGR